MKSKKQTIGNLIGDIQEGIVISHSRKIPDIITFIEGKEWLGLPHHPTNPINLFPLQKVALKVFYRGSFGNENLKLTEEEINLLKEKGLDNEDNGDVLAKYNNGELFRELVLVWGRRCISEDTLLVNPNDGSINKIGDLWDDNLKNLDSWTYNEQENKMQVIDNAEILYQGIRKCYNLTTMSGHEIECTDNHPFLTPRGWIELKDLDISKDKIAICESSPFFGNSDLINEDEAALLGYMTADGNCSQGQVFFSCANKVILEDFSNRLERISDNLRIFNDPWTGARSKSCQYKVVSKEYISKTVFSEERNRKVSSRKMNDLMELMDKWGLKGKICHKKTVPLELFKCSKKVIISYLKALFSCDGNLNSRISKNSKIVTFEFTSVNKKQIVLLQQLLSKFGIIASIRKKRTKSRIVGENGKVYNYDIFSYILFFNRKKYLEILFNKIGLTGKDEFINKAKSFLENIDNKRKTRHNDENPFSFMKIRSIEEIGEKRTFDICVSPIKTMQNFVAQGVIVHNSGKDFCTSIIATYEAMKLLECDGGDPYSMYELSAANTINILTIANSKDQAKIAFSEIRERVNNSFYFQDKFVKEGLTNNAIYLLTPKDKEDNKKLIESGRPIKTGSIGIIVGHSNSDSLLGMGCIVLILDEVASYKNTGGSSSGDRIYTALTPTVRSYVRKKYQKDEDGNFVLNEHKQKIISERFYDGKIISISSPRSQEGIFYDLFKESSKKNNRLAMRSASWDVNPQHTKESLREEESSMSETQFNQEYGAQFSGTGSEGLFVEEQIKKCFFGHNLKNMDVGRRGYVHFVHLDPATSSHNYALVIVHQEFFLNPETKKADYKIIVDHIKYWQPVNGPLDPDKIMDYVISLNKRFNIGLLTYDSWCSVESRNKLRKAGIPNKETKFHVKYKYMIYQELEDLVNTNRLLIPYDQLLYNEMVNIQRKFTPGGFKIMPKRTEHGTNTDDVCDALAGAIYSAVSSTSSRLPSSRLTYLEQAGSNPIAWRNMQGGVYGVGNGGEVYRNLSKKSSSWPPKYMG